MLIDDDIVEDIQCVIFLLGGLDAQCQLIIRFAMAVLEPLQPFFFAVCGQKDQDSIWTEIVHSLCALNIQPHDHILAAFQGYPHL